MISREDETNQAQKKKSRASSWFESIWPVNCAGDDSQNKRNSRSCLRPCPAFLRPTLAAGVVFKGGIF